MYNDCCADACGHVDATSATEGLSVGLNLARRGMADLGRGTIYLTAANLVVLLTGLAINAGLARWLGPSTYGDFAVIQSLMTAAALLVASGFPDATSKYIAEDKSMSHSIMRSSIKIQLVLSAGLLAAYLMLAGVFAHLLRRPELTNAIRISAFVIPTYGLFYVFYSYMNGLRLFGKQSVTMIMVCLARVALIFGLLLLFSGFRLQGAILGYIIAPLVGILLAWRLSGLHRHGPSHSFAWTRLLQFGVPATLFAVSLLLLMTFDLLAVKRMVPEEAAAGYYASASNLSRVIYYAFSGLALAIFPTISWSIRIGDSALTTQYIKQSLRFLAILLIPATVLVCATSRDLIDLVYSSAYADAAVPLSILALAMAFLTASLVIAYILMASGRPYIVLLIFIILVAADVVLNIVLIPPYGLTGAACATAIAAFVGILATATCVFRQFKALVSATSILKACVASFVVGIIAILVRPSPAFLPLVYVGLILAYFLILVSLKELRREDIASLTAILTLRKIE